MMNGDFSRDTFNVGKHFSRVLMQQGRVQLDADWNELQAIMLHYLRTLGKDIFGAHGGAASDKQAFEVSVQERMLLIAPGHYYVDGILCENAGKRAANGALTPIAYGEQANYPLNDAEKKAQGWMNGWQLVYLDVWERFISAIEDDDICEKALGDADTCGRAQVVWQVKLKKVDDADQADLKRQLEALKREIAQRTQQLKDAQEKGDKEAVIKLEAMVTELKQKYDEIFQQLSGDRCEALLAQLQRAKKPLLRARVKPVEKILDPCITAPDSKYRGGNQLYRVEVHQVQHDGSATFKWSRENGSVVAKMSEPVDDTVEVHNIRGFAAKQWVELTDDFRELRGEPGQLRYVIRVDGASLILENGSETERFEWDGRYHPKVRRWDQTASEKQALMAGAVSIKPKQNEKEDPWHELEHGIEVQFELPAGAQFRVGDYWLIPARTATGDIEWPSEGVEIVALPPHGIEHHYAPLAILNNGAISSHCRRFVSFTRT